MTSVQIQCKRCGGSGDYKADYGGICQTCGGDGKYWSSTVPLKPIYMSEEERQRRLNSNPDNEYDGL